MSNESARPEFESAEVLAAVLEALEPDVRSVAETYGGADADGLAQSIRVVIWAAIGELRKHSS